MVVPGFLALDVATLPPLPDARLTLGRRRVRALLTPALLVALSVAFAACYLAEAYTFDRPLQRAVQYVADHSTGRAVWEVAGVEPGLDLDLSRGAPAGWVPSTGPLAPRRACDVRCPHPFAFRAPGVVEPAPVEATLQSGTTAAGSLQIEITARTAAAGSDRAVRGPARSWCRSGRRCRESSAMARGWRRSPRRRPAPPSSRQSSASGGGAGWRVARGHHRSRVAGRRGLAATACVARVRPHRLARPQPAPDCAGGRCCAAAVTLDYVTITAHHVTHEPSAREGGAFHFVAGVAPARTSDGSRRSRQPRCI